MCGGQLLTDLKKKTMQSATDHDVHVIYTVTLA